MSSKPIEISIFGHRIVLVVCIDHTNAVDVVCLDLIYLIRLVYSTAATTEFKANITILALEISKHTVSLFFWQHIFDRVMSVINTLWSIEYLNALFEHIFIRIWTYISTLIQTYLFMWKNSDVASFAHLSGVCPWITGHPFPIALCALVFTYQ